METPNDFEAEIKKEINDAIKKQQSQIESVIKSSRERNSYLSQQLSNYTPVQPREFPDYPECPPRELIEQFYEARRQSLLAQKKKQSLLQIQNHLKERIANAEAILQKEKQESHYRAVVSLSPTAAELLKIKLPQAVRPSKTTIIESTIFEEQLDAIKALKEGISPRPYGEVKYDFDKELEQINEKIAKIKSKNNQLLLNITVSVNNFLQDSAALDNELAQREKDMLSFQKFAKTYYNSNNEIEKLKYTKLLNIIKTIRNNVQEKRFDELLAHLNAEKQMIDEQLSSFGAGDFETNSLKSEIEFQMLYLGHLTAIAGKALSNISTEKVPPDPVEEMQAEIMHMQHILSNSNTM